MAGKLFDELADRASGHHQHAEKQEHVHDLQRLFSMIREMEITPFLLSLGGGNVFLSNGVFARPSLGGSLDGSPGA